MQDRQKLKCTVCRSTLDLRVGYDGCDWDSVKGRGSKFDFVIELVCSCCGRIYPIGRVKNPLDFSELLEKRRPYGSVK